MVLPVKSCKVNVHYYFTEVQLIQVSYSILYYSIYQNLNPHHFPTESFSMLEDLLLSSNASIPVVAYSIWKKMPFTFPPELSEGLMLTSLSQKM